MSDPRFNISLPNTRSILYLTPDLTISSLKPMPNWWWRLWQWLLLGWTWEKP